MAYKLQLKRGLTSALPTGSAGEPLFTTDTNDLYIGTGAGNQRYQKYIASGTSSQFLKGDGSLDSNTYYLASNPSAYIALTALSASSPLSYNNTTGAFTIAQASGSANGYLSSTDWTTFNNKQNALTNPVTGTGTTNYLPKWTSGSALGNSLVYDSGSAIGIGTTTPSGKFQVQATNSGIYFDLSTTYTPKIISSGAISDLHLESTGNGGVFVNKVGGPSSVFQWIADTSERMRLTSTGLGIGTTSPSEKLHVVGNGFFSSSVTTGGDIVRTSSNIGGMNEIAVVNTATSGASSSRIRIQTAFTGGTTLGDAITQYTDNNNFNWCTGSGVTTSRDFVIANHFTLGTNERLRLTTSGNLGLGVVPSAWATLVGFDIVEGGGAISSNQGGLYLTENAYYNAGWKYKSSTISSALYSQVLGTHAWYNAPSGTAGNAISFTQAMTLDASGRLGVGTTAPGTTLDISAAESSIRLTSTTGTNFTHQRIVNTGGSLWSGIERSTGGVLGITGAYEAFLLYAGDNPMYIGTGNSFLRFGTNSTERLRITSTGAAEFSSTIKTAAPSGGTAKPFKIGAAASVSPTSPNRTIEIEIDGTTYYLSAKTTND